MIFGAHAIVYSKDAAADRAFFQEVLGLASADAGHGWLIFALPPAELAVHPTEETERHELYLMCDDLESRSSRWRRRACSARSRWRHGGVPSSPSGFPAAARSVCISRSIQRR